MLFPFPLRLGEQGFSFQHTERNGCLQTGAAKMNLEHKLEMTIKS